MLQCRISLIYFAYDSWQFNSMTQSKIDADDDENDDENDDDDEKFYVSIRWLSQVMLTTK